MDKLDSCQMNAKHVILLKFLYCIVYIYPPFMRKQIVSLYFGQDVRTRLEAAISEVSWATCLPHKGGGVPLSTLPKGTSELPACLPQPPINAEHQARKLWIPFFKVFWYDLTRRMNP